MMEIDEHALRDVWQRQQPPPRLAHELAGKVERHRRGVRIHRVAEVAVTVVGMALLVWPGADGSLSPSQWLLLPFFAVFVAVSWAVVFGKKRRLLAAALEPVSLYVQVRKAQLRDSICHLKLAIAASVALMAYSIAVLLVSLTADAHEWRDAAAGVAAWAAAWTAGTLVLARAKAKTIRQEYRLLERLD